MHRLILLGLTILWLAPALPAPATLPNIVILYADDMGYGDLAVQNPDSRIPTPNLDQLAREGIRFTDAHSSSGICSPSRYALLTGRYHWRQFHDIVQSFGPSVLPAGRLTLPEMLRRKGYHTACIGKWHLGWDWAAIRRPGAEEETVGDRKMYPPDAFDWSRPIPGGPLAHGFDRYFGDDVPNFPPYTWIEDDRVLLVPTERLSENPPAVEGRWEARPGPMAPGWRLDAVMPRLTREAVAWIAAQAGEDRPFFLYFPWTSPHTPIVPTAEFLGKSKAGGYGDYVAQSDWSAGQVLQALDAYGFRDNTLVIFSSDNGPELYAYNRVRDHGHRSTGPLRGLKRDLYEGGHRVPFIVRWPGVVEPGRVSAELISQIDLMATLAAVVGYALPADAAEDSLDLLPLLRGQPGAAGIRTALVHNTFADQYAIRAGDWVLVEAGSGYGSRVPEWYESENGYAPDPAPAALYNLCDDLGQRRNVIAEHPDTALALRALLGRLRGQVRE